MNLREFNAFVSAQKWTFAKTYAKTAPHEYIVEENALGGFSEAASFIDIYGIEMLFWGKSFTYFHHGGKFYWHMGNIINRCNDSDYIIKMEKRNGANL